MNERKPRFKRVKTPGFRVTDRDTELVRAVAQYRLLDSTMLVRLVDGSSQVIVRRLQQLYHHGYLDRPPVQQKSGRYEAGSRPMVYALGNKGADLLAEVDGLTRGSIDWTAKNAKVKERFALHRLLISEVVVSFVVAAREHGRVRVMHWSEIFEQAPAPTKLKKRPLSWHVPVSGAGKMGMTPDALFGLEFLDKPEGRNRAYFMLEADRATMPVVRERLSASSIWKKLRLYHATFTQGLQTPLFGIKRFRVLFVTVAPERISTMIAASKRLPPPAGLFLFADIATMSADVFGCWKDGRGVGVGLV